MMKIPSKKRKNPFSATSFQKTPRLDFNPTEDHDSTSSCSGCGSDMRIQTGDQEDESGSGIAEVEESMCYIVRERKSEATRALGEVEEEDTSSSEKLDSSSGTPLSSHAKSRKKKKSIMPTESELEDFFSQAEKNLQKQFAYKYNYDVVKDMPLEGRYEWLKLKP